MENSNFVLNFRQVENPYTVHIGSGTGTACSDTGPDKSFSIRF